MNSVEAGTGFYEAIDKEGKGEIEKIRVVYYEISKRIYDRESRDFWENGILHC